MPNYSVQAIWNAEAQIWVAGSNDIPGLATGAATLDELIERLIVMIPDLLEQNRHLCLPRAPDFEVHATKGHERFTVFHAFA
jgi:predicted RNase H-like HicB family nuclease